MDTDSLRPDGLDQITEGVIGCAYRVSNTLGAGFLEKVYENALALDLRKAGLQVVQQVPVKVRYDGVIVGRLRCRPAGRTRRYCRTEGCQET